VVITSPLAIVPREVELFYPAQQYDIPVTRTWSLDEIDMINKGLLRYLEKNRYETIIVHLPEDYMFISESLDDYTSTCKGKTTSQTSLAELKKVLTESVKSHDKVSVNNERRESLACFARFQFGEAGVDLLHGAQVKGRYPNPRIFRKTTQVGMLVGDRGLISLTLEGGKVLAEGKVYWVRISDFEPKGNIFAVGVDAADPNIRIGDDVVVMRADTLVGVGVAMMSPGEMVSSSRGEAVRIRHLVKKE
jgi:archaeosine synthase